MNTLPMHARNGHLGHRTTDEAGGFGSVVPCWLSDDRVQNAPTRTCQESARIESSGYRSAYCCFSVIVSKALALMQPRMAPPCRNLWRCISALRGNPEVCFSLVERSAFRLFQSTVKT